MKGRAAYNGALRAWELDPCDVELARFELVGLAREVARAGGPVASLALGELAQGLSNLLVWLDPFRVEWHRDRVDHLLELASLPTDIDCRLRLVARAEEATKELSKFDAGTDGTLEYRARVYLALGLAEEEAGLKEHAIDHLKVAAEHFQDQEEVSGWSPIHEHSLFLAEEALGRLAHKRKSPDEAQVNQER